jgi:hypothetical protein
MENVLNSKILSLQKKRDEAMSTDEIKLQIFRQVDALDATRLKEFYGVMLNYINGIREDDEWVGVTNSEIQGIEAAIEELNAGKGIPLSDVLEQLRTKYTHV